MSKLRCYKNEPSIFIVLTDNQKFFVKSNNIKKIEKNLNAHFEEDKYTIIKTTNIIDLSKINDVLIYTYIVYLYNSNPKIFDHRFIVKASNIQKVKLMLHKFYNNYTFYMTQTRSFISLEDYELNDAINENKRNDFNIKKRKFIDIRDKIEKLHKKKKKITNKISSLELILPSNLSFSL